MSENLVFRLGFLFVLLIFVIVFRLWNQIAYLSFMFFFFPKITKLRKEKVKFHDS